MRERLIWLLPLLLGLGFSAYGLMNYLDYLQGVPDRQPQRASPIRFGFSPGVRNVEMMEIRFNPITQVIEIDMQVSVTEPGEYYFQAILPYNIGEVRADESRGLWDRRNSTSGAVVYATFLHRKDSGDSFKLTAQMDVSDPIVQKDHGRYLLNLPFGGSIPQDITELRKSIIQSVSLRGGQFYSPYSVILELPSHAFFSSSTHQIAEQRTNPDGSKSLVVTMTALEQLLMIHYSIPEEVSRYDVNLFQAALFAGIGLPLLISSISIAVLRQRNLGRIRTPLEESAPVRPTLQEARNRKFQFLLNSVTIRESSTLVVATVASSASLILLGFGPGGNLAGVIGLAGLLVPILGLFFREITIWTRDRVDFEEIYAMLEHPQLPTWRRFQPLIVVAGWVRAFILRTLILTPSYLWALKMSEPCIDCVILKFLVVLFAVAIALGAIEVALRPSMKRA